LIQSLHIFDIRILRCFFLYLFTICSLSPILLFSFILYDLCCLRDCCSCPLSICSPLSLLHSLSICILVLTFSFLRSFDHFTFCFSFFLCLFSHFCSAFWSPLYDHFDPTIILTVVLIRFVRVCSCFVPRSLVLWSSVLRSFIRWSSISRFFGRSATWSIVVSLSFFFFFTFTCFCTRFTFSRHYSFCTFLVLRLFALFTILVRFVTFLRLRFVRVLICLRLFDFVFVGTFVCILILLHFAFCWLRSSFGPVLPTRFLSFFWILVCSFYHLVCVLVDLFFFFFFFFFVLPFCSSGSWFFLRPRFYRFFFCCCGPGFLVFYSFVWSTYRLSGVYRSTYSHFWFRSILCCDSFVFDSDSFHLPPSFPSTLHLSCSRFFWMPFCFVLRFYLFFARYILHFVVVVEFLLLRFFAICFFVPFGCVTFTFTLDRFDFRSFTFVRLIPLFLRWFVLYILLIVIRWSLHSLHYFVLLFDYSVVLLLFIHLHCCCWFRCCYAILRHFVCDPICWIHFFFFFLFWGHSVWPSIPTFICCLFTLDTSPFTFCAASTFRLFVCVLFGSYLIFFLRFCVWLPLIRFVRLRSSFYVYVPFRSLVLHFLILIFFFFFLFRAFVRSYVDESVRILLIWTFVFFPFSVDWTCFSFVRYHGFLRSTIPHIGFCVPRSTFPSTVYYDSRCVFVDLFVRSFTSWFDSGALIFVLVLDSVHSYLVHLPVLFWGGSLRCSYRLFLFSTSLSICFVCVTVVRLFCVWFTLRPSPRFSFVCVDSTKFAFSRSFVLRFRYVWFLGCVRFAFVHVPFWFVIPGCVLDSYRFALRSTTRFLVVVLRPVWPGDWLRLRFYSVSFPPPILIVHTLFYVVTVRFDFAILRFFFRFLDSFCVRFCWWYFVRLRFLFTLSTVLFCVRWFLFAHSVRLVVFDFPSRSFRFVYRFAIVFVLFLVPLSLRFALRCFDLFDLPFDLLRSIHVRFIHDSALFWFWFVAISLVIPIWTPFPVHSFCSVFLVLRLFICSRCYVTFDSVVPVCLFVHSVLFVFVTFSVLHSGCPRWFWSHSLRFLRFFFFYTPSRFVDLVCWVVNSFAFFFFFFCVYILFCYTVFCICPYVVVVLLFVVDLILFCIYLFLHSTILFYIPHFVYILICSICYIRCLFPFDTHLLLLFTLRWFSLRCPVSDLHFIFAFVVLIPDLVTIPHSICSTLRCWFVRYVLRFFFCCSYRFCDS